MTTEEHDKRLAREAARNDFTAHLGMTHRRYIAGGGSIDFMEYDWPKSANGSKYDRTVVAQIYPDQSWQMYLDAPHNSIEDTKRDLALCEQRRAARNPHQGRAARRCS